MCSDLFIFVQVTPLPVLAPYSILFYIHAFHDTFEPILSDFNFIDNKLFLKRSKYDNYFDVYDQMRVKNIECCLVNHCISAYGVSLTTLNDVKIVYSGDCRPDGRLVDMGRGCDLLIHEATLEDALETEAKIKKHCTLSEALEVARRMEARHVVLTHFSQRYAKIPLLPEERLGELKAVAFAYDNMRVTIDDIPRLATLYGEMKKMFAEDVENIIMKQAKRQAAIERNQMLEASSQS